MTPKTVSKKQFVLVRIVRNLERLRADANGADCGMLAFLIAQAQDEAQTQLYALDHEPISN